MLESLLLKKVTESMKTISFSALVKFPGTAYFEFNRVMDGIATIDSVSSEGDDYNANIDFALADLPGCIKAVTALEGEVIEIITNKSYDSVKTTKTVKTFLKKSKKPTKLDELIETLATWHSAKQLRTATGWANSTLHARLTGLRHAKRLLQKTGPDGYLQYKVGKIAVKAA